MVLLIINKTYMNDKRDLQIAAVPMIEWCARYASCDADGEAVNWELYVGNRIIAYNYDVNDAYIIKYLAIGSFPHPFKLDVKYSHKNGSYKLTKKYV